MNKIIPSFTEFNNRNGSNEIFYRVPSTSEDMMDRDSIDIMLPKSSMKLCDLKKYLEYVYNIKIEDEKYNTIL